MSSSRGVHYNAEYEEHFRIVFSHSVQRRLRSTAPVLAELSGGMDSTSIVCMADKLIQDGVAEVPRLDTVSYYNDLVPNWNERPYFEIVEQNRGRSGYHIPVSSKDSLSFRLETDRFAAIPGSGTPQSESASQFATCLISQGNRVVLSGIGGDEILGGVPTPVPELADLLARARLTILARQLKVWALDKRRPWLHLMFESAREFLPRTLAGPSKLRFATSWYDSKFVNRHQSAFACYETRARVFGPLPSFQANLDAIEHLRSQLGCACISSDPVYERRYPYLDRDLLEFVLSIPRDQLLRPGQRRSLMRRSLVGIVPEAILLRKRKAFVSRTPLVAVRENWKDVVRMTGDMLIAEMGIVDSGRFLKAAQEVSCGKVSALLLLRTLALECWLRQLACAIHVSGIKERGPRPALASWIDVEAATEVCKLKVCHLT